MFRFVRERRFARAWAILLGILQMGLCARDAGGEAGVGWPSPLGDFRNTSSTQSSPGSDLKLQRTWPLRLACRTPVATSDYLVVLDDQGVLASIKRRTGEFVWRRTLESFLPHGTRPARFQDPPGSPIIDRGRVFVPLNGVNFGVLVCLDLATGKLIWRSTPNTGGGPGGALRSAAAVEQDRVVVRTHVGVACFKRKTGAQNWATRIDDGLGISVPPRVSILVTDGRVFLPPTLGTAYCLDITDGAVRWSARTAALEGTSDAGKIRARSVRISTCAALAAPRLIVCADGAGQVSALSSESGRLAWTAKIGDVFQLARLGRDVVLAAGAFGLQSMDLRTGRVLKRLTVDHGVWDAYVTPDAILATRHATRNPGWMRIDRKSLAIQKLYATEGVPKGMAIAGRTIYLASLRRLPGGRYSTDLVEYSATGGR